MGGQGGRQGGMQAGARRGRQAPCGGPAYLVEAHAVLRVNQEETGRYVEWVWRRPLHDVRVTRTVSRLEVNVLPQRGVVVQQGAQTGGALGALCGWGVGVGGGGKG